ncbi:MAG: NarK family nitrate/nitrite MFS transporter [Actinomycetes bacterium]
MTVTTHADRSEPGEVAEADVLRRRPGRWIDRWTPEDPAFWESTGRRVAGRNLAFSILAENLGFSVWLLWSVVAVSLPAAGFDFSVDQLFWLVALPNLVGAFMRFPYTFAVPRFGGRNWTMVSAFLLLLPTGLLVACVSRPDTPYWMFLVAAVTAGVGGGNFASSMANISFFYPEGRKGFALGLNAAGGNIGVSIVQLAVPAVIAIGAGIHLAYAGLMWMPLIAVAVIGAWLFMDNLSTARSSFRDQVVVTRRRHTWVMSFLYLGTFGSFIGYSAAFPLLISTQFPAIEVARYAFLGALVGSVARPFGGWLSDRLGGSRVTFWNFAVMGLGVLAVSWALRTDSFAAFLGAFLLLFVTTGIGNGSTFRMIPAIFRAQALEGVPSGSSVDRELALTRSRRESAAVLGFTSAIGAIGGFFIPRAFGFSIAQTGEVTAALTAFLAFYVLSLGVTWWCYLRTRVLATRVPGLASARV